MLAPVMRELGAYRNAPVVWSRTRFSSSPRRSSRPNVLLIDLPINTRPLSLKFGNKSSEWFDNQQLDVATCVPEEGTGAYETLFTYGSTPKKQAKIPREYFKMPAEERDARTWEARNAVGDRLGHPRTSLPARRSDPVRRLPWRLVQALKRSGLAQRSGQQYVPTKKRARTRPN